MDQSPGFATHGIEATAGGRDWSLTALVDRQQYHDPAGDDEAAGVPPAAWLLFGVMWPSSVLLADLMTDRIEALSSSHASVLELGCGLAVPSLTLAARNINVTASDMHPLAARFLHENCLANGVSQVPRIEAPGFAGGEVTLNGNVGKKEGKQVMFASSRIRPVS